MDLTPYITTLREDLSAAAAAGDEQTRRTAAILSAALEPAARLAVMSALSELAAEVTASLDDQIVEIRLAGKDVKVVVTGSPTMEPDTEVSDEEPFAEDDSGNISRVTVRLAEDLKTKAEQTAATQGVSLNAFISRAVKEAVRFHGRRQGNRRGGWQDWGGWDAWGGQNWHGGGHRGQRGGRSSNSRITGWVQG